MLITLPAFQQHEGGEREDEKENETLRFHEVFRRIPPSLTSARPCREFLQQPCKIAPRRCSALRRPAAQLNHHVYTRQAVAHRPEHLADEALCPVTIDRPWRNALGGDNADSGMGKAVGPHEYHEMAPHARSALCQRLGELRPAREPRGARQAGVELLAQTLRRARPLERRARMTARPLRVRMRERNPCVRARRTLDG